MIANKRLRTVFIILLLTVCLLVPAGRTLAAEPTDTCNDAYEPDNLKQLAHVITGAEQHTFSNGKFGAEDVDWVRLDAQAGYVYQFDATVGIWPTQPVLSLYDVSGALLAQNDHSFQTDAEIWWWNNGGNQTVYIKATELRHLTGCDFYYNLEVTPWVPGQFQVRFGNQ